MKNPLEFAKFGTGSVSAAQDMLAYLYDVLEDFICGPENEEEWIVYHKLHEEARREELIRKKTFLDNSKEAAMHMRRMVQRDKEPNGNTVFVKYEPAECEKKGVGADPNPKDYGLEEEGNEYIQCEASNGLWMYAWNVSDNLRDDAPADIYSQMMMNFESYYHAARWYRQRHFDSTDEFQYDTYFHYMTGAMKGVSNACMGVCSRYGFKLWIPEWVELPSYTDNFGWKHQLVYKVTSEYDNFDFNPDRTHDPHVPFGFQGICWYKDAPYDEINKIYGYVEIAHPRVVEGFPPPVSRYKSPGYPNEDNYPGPPGPSIDSVYGLSLQTMDPRLIPEDPDPKGTGFHRPKWWDSSGLIIDGGVLTERGWEGSIMRVNCGGGLRIDAEGNVVVHMDNGLQLWPIATEPEEKYQERKARGEVDDDDGPKVYSVGGIGINETNIRWLTDIFENLETCDSLIKAAKCLEKIKNVAPCL